MKNKVIVGLILLSLVFVIGASGCSSTPTSSNKPSTQTTVPATTTAPPVPVTTANEYANLTVDSAKCLEMPKDNEKYVYYPYRLEIKGHANASTGTYIALVTNPTSSGSLAHTISTCPNWGPLTLDEFYKVECARTEGMPESTGWEFDVDGQPTRQYSGSVKQIVHLSVEIHRVNPSEIINKEAFDVECQPL